MNAGLIHLCLRITARISFALFLGAFSGEGLWKVWPSAFTEWLRRRRSQFVLGSAGSHTLHLAFVFALVLNNPQRFRATHPIVVLVVGGVVYGFIYGLAAAAFIDWKSACQRHIVVLHSTGFQVTALYTIWLVFALAFVGGTFRKPVAYASLGLAAVGALIVRLAAAARETRCCRFPPPKTEPPHASVPARMELWGASAPCSVVPHANSRSKTARPTLLFVASAAAQSIWENGRAEPM